MIIIDAEAGSATMALDSALAHVTARGIGIPGADPGVKGAAVGTKPSQ